MKKPLIKGRKPGDDITILNTMYLRYKDEHDKWKDCMLIIYRDNETGTKHKAEIMSPTYEYFIINEDKRTNYNQMFISEKDATAVEVPYMNLEKDMAERAHELDKFYENIRNGQAYQNKRIHLNPMFMNSDMNIEDHYRFRFSKMYTNTEFKVSKAYFDIEADTINMAGDFPEPGECPINAISLVLEEQRQIYVFLLRNEKNPQIEEFEKYVSSGMVFPELDSFIVDAVGGPKAAKKYNMNFKFKFMFYDEKDEINLIKDLFSAINTFRPDFVLAWNMSFDIPYIINRIQRLGYNPTDIMCPKEFNIKSANYYVDERNKNEYAERGDMALISSYSVYLDQMIQFASRRKGQSRFLSFSLDYIGEVQAKVRKLDYKDITTNLSELPYKDYKTFVFYNIMDTIVQYCIEFKTGDINYVFNKSLMNNTRYSKVHRQTVYLANRGTISFHDTDKFIIGNNINRYNVKPEEKFPGAFVADPLKINDYSRVRIFGRPVNVFYNCIDEDFSSLYPSLIRMLAMMAHMQIGKLFIEKQVYNRENPANLDIWTRAGSFMEDLQSQVRLEFATRWLGLADYEELYNDVVEFFTKCMNALNGLSFYNYDGTKNPITFYDNKKKYIQPIEFFDNKLKPVEEKYKYFDVNKMEEWRRNAIANPNQRFY